VENRQVNILNLLFWEFIENLPLIMTATLVVWWWGRQDRKKAVVVAIVGSIAGALFIRVTEPMKRPGYVEPVEITLVNIAFLVILIIPFAAYLTAESKWSNWKLDVGLGAGRGRNGVCAGIFFAGASNTWSCYSHICADAGRRGWFSRHSFDQIQDFAHGACGFGRRDHCYYTHHGYS
jgi:hypothetical protein